MIDGVYRVTRKGFPDRRYVTGRVEYEKIMAREQRSEERVKRIERSIQANRKINKALTLLTLVYLFVGAVIITLVIVL